MALQVAARVPAWKKLGLKLKRPAEPVAEAGPATKKRRRASADTGGQETSTGPSIELIKVETYEHKPARSSKGQKFPTQPVAEVEHAQAPQSTAENDLGSAKRKSRKSVSFSSEAKVNDGDGTRGLWSKSDESLDSAEDDSSGAALQPKKAKKPKKPKRPKQSTSASTPAPATRPESENTVYLNYLDLYRTDRSSWKFNKKYQVWLMKNLFDLHRIPTSYDTALISYFAALQGETARLRLKEDAKAVLSQLDADDPNQPKASGPRLPPTSVSADAPGSVAAQETEYDLQPNRLQKRVRAVQILAALADSPNATDSKQIATEPANGRKPRRRGGRGRGSKRRLGSDGDDSSSSSSEYSDSDDASS